MAWNANKQRFECDRCGKIIPYTQTVQLCKECDCLLEKRYNLEASIAEKESL